jgi:hypothetical protein
MKEPYAKGVADHRGPESCIGSRKGSGEALTGESAGRVLSSEITFFGVPTLSLVGEGHTLHGVIASRVRPHGVLDPVHVRTLYAREPGDPTIDLGDGVPGPHRESLREYDDDER